MKNGIVINNEDFEILGGQTLSIGQGVETKQRFSYDSSHNPQSIVYRIRKVARSANLNIVINRSIVQNLFSEKDRYEAIVGKMGDLWWNDEYIGLFLIKSVQFSLATDPIDIISGLQIGVELVEGYQAKKAETPTNIKLL